jgi:hypothetical protein
MYRFYTVTFIEQIKNVENVPEEQEKVNIRLVSELQNLRSELDEVKRKQTDVPVAIAGWNYVEPFQVPTPSTFDDSQLRFHQCIDAFDVLSNHGKKEISEKALIERLKSGLFSEKEAKETI